MSETTEKNATADYCSHCDRAIVRGSDGVWIDPDATGDDKMWRETCDSHDTFQAEHEPVSDECECNENYGPCEDHMNVLAQREGASSRTGAELALVFLCDVQAILEADGRGTTRIDEMLSYWGEDHRWNRHMGVETLVDSENDSEALRDDVELAEGMLGDVGANVYWEDGYVISRTTGGPLA